MNKRQEAEYQKWLCDTIGNLKNEHKELAAEYEDARSAWMRSDWKDHSAYDKYSEIKQKMHTIALQLDHLKEEFDGAKYAIYCIGTDKYCYEIIEKKSKSTFVVRHMECKCVNGQEEFYSNESAMTFEIRRKRNLMGFTSQGRYLYLSKEPVEYLDPSF